MKTLNELKQQLLEHGYSYVLSNGHNEIAGYEKGVKPLVDLIDGKGNYNGYLAADKIVGKAAALLYSVLGVCELYADVTTPEAISVCNAHGIKVSYTVLTDKIINRKGDDICPMEKTVVNIDDPLSAYNVIKSKIASMQNKA